MLRVQAVAESLCVALHQKPALPAALKAPAMVSPAGRARKPYTSVPLPLVVPLIFHPIVCTLSLVPDEVLDASTVCSRVLHSVSAGTCQPVGQMPRALVELDEVEAAPFITWFQVSRRPYFAQESLLSL